MSVLGGRTNRLDPRLAFNQICALQFMTPARGCFFQVAAFVPDRWGMNFDNVAKSPTFDIVVALVTATIKDFNYNNRGP